MSSDKQEILDIPQHLRRDNVGDDVQAMINAVNVMESQSVLITKLQQELAEANDAMSQAQWQPIESAPKDGTIVLLCADVPWLIRMGYFEPDDRWYSIPQGSMENDQPTHWMPLPSPPQEQSDE